MRPSDEYQRECRRQAELERALERVSRLYAALQALKRGARTARATGRERLARKFEELSESLQDTHREAVAAAEELSEFDLYDVLVLKGVTRFMPKGWNTKPGDSVSPGGA